MRASFVSAARARIRSSGSVVRRYPLPTATIRSAVAWACEARITSSVSLTYVSVARLAAARVATRQYTTATPIARFVTTSAMAVRRSEMDAREMASPGGSKDGAAERAPDAPFVGGRKTYGSGAPGRFVYKPTCPFLSGRERDPHAHPLVEEHNRGPPAVYRSDLEARLLPHTRR